MSMEEIIDYKGYRIRIIEDIDYESPNDWGDNEMFLVFKHRDFTVKKDGFDPKDIYEDGLAYGSNYWIFPVEAYIHSGVSLSLFSGTKQCQFDSSVAGYILSKKGSIIPELQQVKFDTEEELHRHFAENLIKTWNQYLSGDVWGFIIEKPNTIYSISKEKFDKIFYYELIESKDLVNNFDIEDEWEEGVDSCWGFYGVDAAIDEAKAVIDNLTKNV